MISHHDLWICPLSLSWPSDQTVHMKSDSRTMKAAPIHTYRREFFSVSIPKTFVFGEGEARTEKAPTPDAAPVPFPPLWRTEKFSMRSHATRSEPSTPKTTEFPSTAEKKILATSPATGQNRWKLGYS